MRNGYDGGKRLIMKAILLRGINDYIYTDVDKPVVPGGRLADPRKGVRAVRLRYADAHQRAS